MDADGPSAEDRAAANESSRGCSPCSSMLSPRYMTKSSWPRNSRATRTQWANPNGSGWWIQVTVAPNREPSPTAAITSSAVSPTMIPMSVIPASTMSSSA